MGQVEENWEDVWRVAVERSGRLLVAGQGLMAVGGRWATVVGGANVMFEHLEGGAFMKCTFPRRKLLLIWWADGLAETSGRPG